MSTRADIQVIDGYGTELWFYRHSDGYPAGALPTLGEFMRKVVEEKIRDNTEQASGWLIVVGRDEYGNVGGWKVGAYEPSSGPHGDTEYRYELDLQKKEIRVFGICPTEHMLGKINAFDPQNVLAFVNRIQG